MEGAFSFLLVDFSIPEDISPNRTGNQTTFSSSSPNAIEWTIRWASFTVSLINFITHFLSFLVFSKWEVRPIIILLILLSISESAFNFGYFSLYLILYLFDQKNPFMPAIHRIAAIIIYAFLYPCSVLFVQGCLLIRNWTVTMIAVARYEAIKCPLKPKKFCQGKSLAKVLSVLVILSLSAGFVRIFDRKIIANAFTNKIMAYKPFLMDDGRSNYIFVNVIFLLLRAGGPCISAFLYFALRYQLHKASQTLVRKSSCVLNRSSSKEDSANRTAAFIWIMFCILEIPQCIVYIIYHILRLFSYNEVVAVANLTFFLGSTANFCIYGLSNQRFRLSLWQLLRCRKRPPRRRHNLNISMFTGPAGISISINSHIMRQTQRQSCQSQALRRNEVQTEKRKVIVWAANLKPGSEENISVL